MWISPPSQYGRIGQVLQVPDYSPAEQPCHRVEPVDQNEQFGQNSIDGVIFSTMGFFVFQYMRDGILLKGIGIDKDQVEKGASVILAICK